MHAFPVQTKWRKRRDTHHHLPSPSPLSSAPPNLQIHISGFKPTYSERCSFLILFFEKELLLESEVAPELVVRLFPQQWVLASRFNANAWAVLWPSLPGEGLRRAGGKLKAFGQDSLVLMSAYPLTHWIGWKQCWFNHATNIYWAPTMSQDLSRCWM